MGRISWNRDIVAVLAVVVVVAGLGEFSVQSSTCMMCHTQEAAYSDFMKARLSKEKKGFTRADRLRIMPHERRSCPDGGLQVGRTTPYRQLYRASVGPAEHSDFRSLQPDEDPE